MECKLKKILDERGMKQKFLAEKAGLTEGTVSAICKGKTTDPRISVCHRIAKALDMTIEEIWQGK